MILKALRLSWGLKPPLGAIESPDRIPSMDLVRFSHVQNIGTISSYPFPPQIRLLGNINMLQHWHNSGL